MNVSGTLRVIHQRYCKPKSLLYPRNMKLLFNSPSIQQSRYRSGGDLTCGFHNVVSQKFPNRPFRSLKRNSQNQMFIDATRTFRENMKLCSKICVQLNALQFFFILFCNTDKYPKYYNQVEYDQTKNREVVPKKGDFKHNQGISLRI